MHLVLYSPLLHGCVTIECWIMYCNELYVKVKEHEDVFSHF